MPSGFSTAVVDAVLDKIAGASADNTLIGATVYVDLLTTAPSDDNGTGAVGWTPGRTSFATVNGTNWPAASGRTKIAADLTLATNSTGSTITVVAFALYTASTSGTYIGGGPVPGDTLDVPDGTAPIITMTLSAPSPS